MPTLNGEIYSEMHSSGYPLIIFALAGRGPELVRPTTALDRHKPH